MAILSEKRSQQWYSELGGLISSTPDISKTPLPVEALVWFGRVFALLIEMGQAVQAVDFKSAFEQRTGTTLSSPEMQMEKMKTALYIALGAAERFAPSGAIGQFIPVSSPHDALLAISPVLGGAISDLLIVDPYMSQALINNFALSAGEGVKLRLLSGDKKTSADLLPALRAWRQQRPERPIEVRAASQRLLHDRLIIPDGQAWWLSQSFNTLAKRSPAALQKFKIKSGDLKLSSTRVSGMMRSS